MAVSPKHLKKVVYEQLAVIGKALASPVRLEMIDVLSQGPKTVEVLSTDIGQSLANTSQHLQVLRSAKLIEAEKSGVYVEYRIADRQVLTLASLLRRLGESRLSEIQTLMRMFLEERNLLEIIDCDTLVQRIQQGEVTVIDVRPPAEYAAGHIPNALSVPLEELEQHMDLLPKDREIVAYCRGPLCVMSIDAVKVLRSKGLQATRWEEGVADWVARGFAPEIGNPA